MRRLRRIVRVLGPAGALANAEKALERHRSTAAAVDEACARWASAEGAAAA